MPTSRSGKPLPQWGKGTADARKPQPDPVVGTGSTGNETATRPDRREADGRDGEPTGGDSPGPVGKPRKPAPLGPGEATLLGLLREQSKAVRKGEVVPQ